MGTLTDLKIKYLKGDGLRQRDEFDDSLPAFGVRVSPHGTKSFFVFYRVDGKLRRYTLGRWPALTLRQARQRAKQVLLIAGTGRDPKIVDGTDRLHAKPSFSDFVAEFMEKYAKVRNRTWGETNRLLQREFVTQWGKRPLNRITRSDINSVLDGIVSRGSMSLANAAFAAVRKLFNWAVQRGHLESSPCAGLKAPSSLVSRDRVLTDSELAAVWVASDKLGYPYGTFVKLLILSAQRRSEVANACRAEFDLQTELWDIPARRTKNQRTHTVPLTKPVIQQLKSLPYLHDELLFPAYGSDKPISGFSKWKRELDSLSGVQGWRLHDLQRTAASGMARLKVPPHVIERVLNHSGGVLGGIAGVYNRHGYINEMKEALDAWNKHIAQILAPNALTISPHYYVV